MAEKENEMTEQTEQINVPREINKTPVGYMLSSVVIFTLTLAVFRVIAKNVFEVDSTQMTMISIGVITLYLSAIFRYIAAPNVGVVEFNFPKMETLVMRWSPGLHILWVPIKPLMYVKNIVNCAEDMEEVTMGVEDDNLGKADMVEFVDAESGVHIQLIFKVFDPILVTYAIDDYKNAAANRIEARLRRGFAGMKLEKAMSDVEKDSDLAKEIFQEINESITKWGVRLVNPQGEISIINFILEQTLKDARNKILIAEKTKEGTIIESRGKAESIRLVKEAEGSGEAQKVVNFSKATRVGNKVAMDYHLRTKMAESMKDSTVIATSGDGNVNLPTQFAASFFGVGEGYKKKNKPEENKED